MIYYKLRRDWQFPWLFFESADRENITKANWQKSYCLIREKIIWTKYGRRFTKLKFFHFRWWWWMLPWEWAPIRQNPMILAKLRLTDGCTPNISPPHPSGRWLPRMLTPCILRMSRKDTGQTGFQFREKGSICSCGYTVRRIRYSTAIGQRRPLESDRELPRTIIIRKFTSIQHFWKKHLFCMSLTNRAVFGLLFFFCHLYSKHLKSAWTVIYWALLKLSYL